MGLVFHSARMLCKARRDGASFKRTLMVGHQSICLYPVELKRLAAEFPVKKESDLSKYCFGAYSDDFFHDFLDTQSITAVDASDYEGAAFVHDLNRPVSPEWDSRFDAVVEAATLEHVFDIRTAFANLMRMAKVGGHVYACIPANNQCGHGFYQFSPEFVYRVFSQKNGFEIRQVIIIEAKYPSTELSPMRRAFRVVDPAAVQSRVMLTSGRPTYLAVDALKTAEVIPFEEVPQQSDYVAAWHPSATGVDRASELLKRIKASIPFNIKNHLRGYHKLWKHSLANRKFYPPVCD